jgi:hypothetical protein
MVVELDQEKFWNTLISNVEKEHVPIDCVKSIKFKLKGGKQKTINLNRLRKEGLGLEEIETVVTKKIVDFSGSTVNIDFVIDIDVVRDTIQTITDEILDSI